MARWFPGILAAFAFVGCTTAAPKEPVTLAHIYAQTGVLRDLGREARQGVQLAVEEINTDDQGILGRALAVRELDTGGNPETAQQQTVRLLSLQRAAAVVAGPDAATSEQVTRFAHPYPTTVVVAGELPEAPRGDGALTLGADPRKRGKILSTYAAEELKAKRPILLIDKRDPVGKSVAAAFQDAWPHTAAASAEEWISPDLSMEKDLSKRLADTKTDLVVICGSISDFLKLRTQFAADKFAAPLLFGGEDNGPHSLQENLAGPTVYLATIAGPGALSDTGKALAKKYQDRFHEPLTLAAIQAYDAVRLVAEMIQRNNSTSALDLKAQVNRLEKFESSLGSVTWKDHVAKRPIYVVRIQDKESTVVRTVKADE